MTSRYYDLLSVQLHTLTLIHTNVLYIVSKQFCTDICERWTSSLRKRSSTFCIFAGSPLQRLSWRGERENRKDVDIIRPGRPDTVLIWRGSWIYIYIYIYTHTHTLTYIRAEDVRLLKHCSLSLSPSHHLPADNRYPPPPYYPYSTPPRRCVDTQLLDDVFEPRLDGHRSTAQPIYHPISAFQRQHITHMYAAETLV